MEKTIPQRLLNPAKEISLRRPYETPGRICGTAFSTLKRGAGNHCASGALDLTYAAANNGVPLQNQFLKHAVGDCMGLVTDLRG